MRISSILLVLFFISCLAAQTPRQSYREGLRFYRQGSYRQALKFFQQAETADRYQMRAWLYQGKCHYCLGKYERDQYRAALEFYEKILERRSNSVDALYGRARVYYKLGDAEKALDDLKLLSSVYPDNLYVCYLSGLCYLIDENFESAAEKFQEAISLQPSFGKAYRQLGQCRLEQGKYDSALAFFDKALEHEGDVKSIYFSKAKVYNYLREERPDALEKAVENFRKVLAVDPKHEPSWEQLGAIYFEQEDYKQALYAYDRAIEIAGDKIELYRWRGMLHYQMHHYLKAENDFQKVLANDENDPDLSFYQGCILEKLGKDEEALKVFEKLINVKYDYWEAYFKCAKIHMKSGDYPGAFNWYDKLTDMGYDEEMYRVYFGLGESKRLMGKYNDIESAIMHFNECLQDNPDYAPAYASMSEIKEKRRKYQEALQLISQAIDIEPRNVKYYTQRGQIQHMLGDNEKALEDFSNAIGLEPKNCELYYWRGMIYYAQSDLVAANEDFSEAIKINPQYALAYYMRGKCYNTNPKRALQDYDRAIELNPENPMFYNDRGLVYHSSGQWNKAVVDFTRAIMLREDSEFYYNRADVSLKMKEFHKALDDCTHAIKIEENKKNYKLRAEIYDALGEHDLAEDDRKTARVYD